VIGLGQPAWNALGSEVSPVQWRMAMAFTAQILFPAGELYSSALLVADDPSLSKLHWRPLLRCAAIPSGVLFFFAYWLLRESPSYLAVQGRREEARAVLQDMNRDNGYMGGEAVDSLPAAPPGEEEDEEVLPRRPGAATGVAARIRAQVRIVFGEEMLGSTLIVSYTIFVLNMAYYGSVYGLPFVLQDVMMLESPANELLVGVLWEFVGFLFAFIFGMSMSRKRVMRCYLCLCACCFLAFVLGAHAPPAGSPEAVAAKDASRGQFGLVGRITTAGDFDFNALIARAGYYGTKVGLAVGFMICYQYSVEIYPTSARMTGCAFVLSGGRIAAMLAPMLYEGMVGITGSFLSFFFIVVGFMLVNIILIDWLPFETAGMGLADTLEDMVAAMNPAPPSRRAFISAFESK